MKSRFFLVGFMAAGKTTLGRRVAERMELPFFDLDQRVEDAYGGSVSQIFSERGESAFRPLESEALAALVAREPRGIIATGGGAFTVDENRRLMTEAGVIVWLDVPADEILTRMTEAPSRPLWKSQEDVRRLHEERQSFYRTAHRRLSLALTNPDEGAERLYRLLDEYRKAP